MVGRDQYGQPIPFNCSSCLHQPARYGFDGYWYCDVCYLTDLAAKVVTYRHEAVATKNFYIKE